MRPEADCLDSESDSGSAITVLRAGRSRSRSPVLALGEPDSTATAVAPRPRGPRHHSPTVSFPPRHCPFCTDAKLFMFRSAFQLHLRKRHGQFLSNRGFCAPVPPVRGQGGWGVAPPADTRPLPSRPVQPLLSLPVTMPSQPAAAPRPLLPPEELAALLRPAVHPLLSPVEVATPPRPAICPLLLPEETASLLRPAVRPLMSLAPSVSSQPDSVPAGPRPSPSPVEGVPSSSALAQPTTILPALPRSGIPAGIGVLPPAHAVTRVEAFRPPFPGPRPQLLLPARDSIVAGPYTQYDAVVARVADDGGPSNPPSRDCGPIEPVPVSLGGFVSAGDGGFPLMGIRNPARDRSLLAPSPPAIPLPMLHLWTPAAASDVPVSVTETCPPPPPLDVSLPALVTPVSTGSAITDTSADMSWAVTVTTAERVGELVPNPSAMPACARPVLNFRHILFAMRPHWQDGLDMCPRVAQRLLDNCDCQDATVDQVADRLVAMVFQRVDIANTLLDWLQQCLNEPGTDACTILSDLQEQLQQMTTL